jgi:hypothetical protein
MCTKLYIYVFIRNAWDLSLTYHHCDTNNCFFLWQHIISITTLLQPRNHQCYKYKIWYDKGQIFACLLCRSMFDILSFSFWPLCFLCFFELLCLISPLVSFRNSADINNNNVLS